MRSGFSFYLSEWYISHLSATHSGDPVLLEQMEEGSPCVLKFHCNPSLPATIGRLLVISEARTMEVYSQTGEYCGTVRGSKDDSIQLDRYTGCTGQKSQ